MRCMSAMSLPLPIQAASGCVPEDQGVGLIVVTKGNPSRGSGFQIAHFQELMNLPINLSAFDRFLPTFKEATAWVTSHYPSACVRSIRRNASGMVAGISFHCELHDIFHPSATASGEAGT